MCSGIKFSSMKTPTILDLVAPTRDELDFANKMGLIVFENRPVGKDDLVQPMYGPTYDRDTLSGVDVTVMMKQLELEGGSGRFVLVLPTGHTGPTLPGLRVTHSDALVYPGGSHGDAILMIEKHPNTQEAMHIAIARGFRIK